MKSMLTTSDLDRMLAVTPSPELRDVLLDLRNGECLDTRGDGDTDD